MLYAQDTQVLGIKNTNTAITGTGFSSRYIVISTHIKEISNGKVK